LKGYRETFFFSFFAPIAPKGAIAPLLSFLSSFFFLKREKVSGVSCFFFIHLSRFGVILCSAKKRKKKKEKVDLNILHIVK
jgi:hypothetical protein